MASSLSTTPATMLRSIQDKSLCPSSSSSSSSAVATSTRLSSSLSQLSYRREVLGTALFFHQNQNASDASSFSHHHYYHHGRNIIVEAAKRVDNKRTYILSSTLKARDGETENHIRDWALAKKVKNDRLSKLKRSHLCSFFSSYVALIYILNRLALCVKIHVLVYIHEETRGVWLIAHLI